MTLSTDQQPPVSVVASPYLYWAVVTDVHDGDTISCNVDLGFNMWLHARGFDEHDPERTSFRLLGCNARELSQPGGPEARDHLAGLLPVGTKVMICTVKRDKFGGRWDAGVIMPDGSDLVAQLVAQQWAAAWDGTGPKPVPPWPRTVTP